MVTIARFIVNKRPSSIVLLKCINKYWYQCLNPNKPNVNALWQHNICRAMFIHIPKNLKIKRWDRYYQYRYHSILRYRKKHGDTTKINKKLVYTKFKVIENCTHDVDEVNAFYRDPFIFEDDDNSVKIKKKGKAKKGNEDMEDEKDIITDTLYHGVSEAFATPSYSGTYYGPISTTPIFNVAKQFAGSQGRIFELYPSFGRKGLKVSWLSNFPDEMEVLYMNTSFQIVNIYKSSDYIYNNIYNQPNQVLFEKSILKALHVINTESNGIQKCIFCICI